MKMFIAAFVLFAAPEFICAQKITANDLRTLSKREDSLKMSGLTIIRGRNAADRLFADSAFTKIFVRSLKTKNSFDYPFDSLITISKIYPPDSSFRIFTWQLQINENVIRQHGAIQMKTPDGSLKLFPLIDKSDITQNLIDTIGNNAGWMGAVYYRIVEKKINDRKIYTLFGFDENNIKSDRKIMEILEFVNGQPVFGNKLFVFENSNAYQKNMTRFVLEYKKEAVTRLTYDADMDVVIYDELVSETSEPNKKWTLVPDGEFEGFKWINGRWVHRKEVFDGPPPTKYIAPATIRDPQGNPAPSKFPPINTPEQN